MHSKVVYCACLFQTYCSMNRRTICTQQRSLYTGVCIKAVWVKAGFVFLPVLLSKWESMFMRFPAWHHRRPATLKVLQDSLATFPFIVSFFSCVLQLPRTRQSAWSSGRDRFMAASETPVNTGSWNRRLCIWKPLSSYLFLSCPW